MKLIAKYKALEYEKKVLLTSKFSIILNICMSIIKIVGSIFFGVFFLASGIVNIFVSLSKLCCYFGIKKGKEEFNKANFLTSLFLGLAGLQYTLYMLRLILWNQTITAYPDVVAIAIAAVSFVEISIAIYGLIKTVYHGYLYRNLKIINFTSSLTAMMLTMVALLSFTMEGNIDRLCGICGAIVGGIIILLAIYMFFAPSFSIIDKEYNEYHLLKDKKTSFEKGSIKVVLADSFFFGGYVYEGVYEQNTIKGHIVRKKHKMGSLNIFVKILLIILSEILIFVYAIGKIIFYLKHINMIKRLDKIMELNNFIKIDNYE